MSIKKVTDANLSNAGDDFHILWTIRKALELLNAKEDGLKVIALEGLTSAENAFVDPDGDICLGVDLTEYYGAETFADAKQLVISQLKYSTVHPDLDWTAARLCAGKNGGQDGSVIHRLARFYEGLAQKYDRGNILEKTRLKLVSNRPVANSFLNSLEKVKSLIQGDSTLDWPTLKAGIKGIQPVLADIERLENASGLNGQHFTDFLSLLDFDDCDTDSRFTQKQNVYKAIASYGSANTKVQYDQLHTLVWSKMMPESKTHNEITATDILYTFGFSDLQDMFPVTSKFETTSTLIEREQLKSIVDGIKKSTDRILCIHGGAGIGKSTIVNQFQAVASGEMDFVMFDCYGAGSYLDPDDNRHKPERAYLQLCNDLALKIGSPFLLNNNLSSDRYLTEFTKRLKQAAEAISKSRKLICIVIDAADNSVSAALKNHHETFVHQVVNIEVPEHCRIVLTCRTERKHTLKLPDHVETIALNPFSTNETRQLLRKHYPSVTKKEITEFHKLTYATPRVMQYVLTQEGQTLADKLKPLRPGGKTLDDIFRISIKTATKRSGGNDSMMRAMLSYLIALPRPVPIDALLAIGRFDDNLVDDIRTDLWHGLIYHGTSVSFRDEDFEVYLRKVYSTKHDQWIKIAKYFFNNASISEYSSTHLGLALANAGMKKELESVVIDRKFSEYPKDPIKNKEVLIERTRLAMRLCAGDSTKVNFLKLQLIAAEANKVNSILEDILLNNAELASSYGNFQANQKLYFQSGNPEWFGHVHFRSAAVFSRQSETWNLAKEHYRKAQNWMEYRNGLPDPEKEKFKITRLDLAFGAEFILRCYGSTACFEWLSRWHPKAFVFGGIELLIENLISTTEVNKLNEWFESLNISRVDVASLVVSIFFKHGLKSPIALAHVLEKEMLLSRSSKYFEAPFSKALLSTCECALSERHEYSKVKPFLDLIPVEIPNHIPNFYDSQYRDDLDEKDNIDFLFRKIVLQKQFEGFEPSVELYYSKRILDGVKDQEYEKRSYAEQERKDFNSLFSHFLEFYDVRAKFLFGLGSSEDRDRSLDSAIKSLRDDYEFNRRQYDAKYRYKFLAVRLVDIVYFSSASTIVKRLVKGFEVYHDPQIEIPLTLAQRISFSKRLSRETSYLLTIVEKNLQTNPIAGQEKLAYYTRATIAASRISPSLGKHFFDLMVLSSNEIDVDAHAQLLFIDNLMSDQDDLSLPKTASKYANYIEYCYVHLKGYDHFPWAASVRGLSHIDMGTAFISLCKWDHRAVRPLKKHILQILSLSVERGFLSPQIAAGLFSLNAEFWKGMTPTIENILKMFDKAKDRQGKARFVDHMIMDIKIHTGIPHITEFIESFYDLIKSGKYLDKVVIDDLKEYKDSISACIRPEPKESYKTANQKVVKTSIYKRITRNVNPTSGEQITKMLQRFRLADQHFNEPLLFSQLKEQVSLNGRIQYLDILLDIVSASVRIYELEKILKETLDLWANDPQVKAWKKANLSKLIRLLFKEFTAEYYFNTRSIITLSEIFDASPSQLAEVLMKVVPEHLDNLSSTHLYELFELTHGGIISSDKEMFLRWVIDRWHGNIKPGFVDTQFDSSMSPPKQSQLTIARFLKYILGHPEKAWRWRAATTLRRFSDFNEHSILRQLLKEQNVETCLPFQDDKRPYFWISSKLYLWIAIARIAKESPRSVQLFSKLILQELKDESLPHVLIYFFIRDVCRTLIKHNRNTFSATDTQFIDSRLTTISRRAKLKRGKTVRKKTSKLSFKFDTLDTLSYWYRDLGRVFGLSENAVASIADQYISGTMGYVGDVNKDNHVHTQDYHDTYNYHGGETKVENLQRYYEFHAMFCAAFTLMTTQPVSKDPHEETLEEWINGWATCWNNFWLVDLRDPVPLVRRYWDSRRQQENWQWSIRLEDFHKSIGLMDQDPSEKNLIPIWAHENIHYGKDYSTSAISSGLVEIKTGPALVRAIQTSQRFEFHIPHEEDDEDQETGPLGSQFKIKSIAKEARTDISGLDDTDERYNDIAKYRMRLIDDFVDFAEGEFTEDLRFLFDKKDESISVFQSWNDNPNTDRFDDFYSYGSRLLVNKSILLNYLKDRTKCLIICVDLNRRIESKEFNKYYRDSFLVYLIYPNGKIETMVGDHKLR